MGGSVHHLKWRQSNLNFRIIIAWGSSAEFQIQNVTDNLHSSVVILFTSSANGCKILKMHMLSSCSTQQTEVKASKKSQLYNLRQATLKCANYERYTLHLIYLTRKFHTVRMRSIQSNP